MVEFAKDIALAKQHLPICIKVDQLAEMVRNACLAVSCDGYVTALAIYRVAKALNTTGQYDAFVEEFGQRFARRRRSTGGTGGAGGSGTPG